MAIRKPVLFLLLFAGIAPAVALLCVPNQRNSEIPTHTSRELVRQSHDRPPQSQLSQAYGKIGAAADISIDFEPTDDPGAPLTIFVSALSKAPVSSGVITLKVPDIGVESGTTELMWSASSVGYVDEIAAYIVDPLPVGRYRFIGVFTFTPDREDARELAISASLYLDVRPTGIVSSNISFDQMKRDELWRELERRAVARLRPGLASADKATTAREIALLEAGNPGIIAREIAQIRATDPDVAYRIRQLNRVGADMPQMSNVAEVPTQMSRGIPARERPAASPEGPGRE